jgi:putative peptide zinc metalloprotease protein
MLCPTCRRWLTPADARCRGCGAVRPGAGQLDLVLPDGRRIALDRSLDIGRGRGNDLQLEDGSVSRHHARIEVAGGRPTLDDAGSRFGTLLDGRPVRAPAALAAGMRIAVGDIELTVDAHESAAAPRTISMPAGVSLVVDRATARRVATSPAPRRPRLRSGWSLKELQSAGGGAEHVLKDHRSSHFHRLSSEDAALLALLDGRREIPELVDEAARRLGPDGPARLARLLAELADQGLLAGVRPASGGAGAAEPRDGRARLRALVRPREHVIGGVPALVATVYRRGGFLVFTPGGLLALGVLALMGLGAFVTLIVAGLATPLLVGRSLGLGALALLLGRLAIVVLHELAHGLAAEGSGRGILRAGVKWVIVFPYAFVDVSDAWFDGPRRRIAIALAGPASDLVIGGACALACALVSGGAVRDVLFQVALAAYLGALFNLNPLLERDGYHVLSDLLGQPGLRRAAMARFTEVLAGRRSRAEARGVLLRYGVASVCWSAVTVGFAIAMSLRYYHRLVSVAPPALVWTLLAAFYVVLAIPLAVQLLLPLRHRRTGGTLLADE